MADTQPRYMISVAADLVGMHPQTLRMYEQKGLVSPRRTPGNTRLYSEADLERLKEQTYAAAVEALVNRYGGRASVQ